jgi:putative methyltransferase
VARAVERVHESESGTIDSRIDKLRNFQIMALRKALTFPQMQRVVYSTCSVHDEENESVVAEVLNNRIVCEADASSSDAAKQAAKDSAITSLVSADWELVAPIGFEDWTRRGNASSNLSEQQSACLLRCLPEDGTNGFFVAMFQRKAASTTAYNLVTIATAPEKSADGGNYSESKKRKGGSDGEHNQEGFVKKNKQSNAPAFDRNAIVARNQQKKTVHIPPTDGTASLITTGSLFGKKRFAVSKSAKRTFGKKK